MQKILDWLRTSVNNLQYGTVIVKVVKHQGEVTLIEKQIIETEKRDTPKHKNIVVKETKK